MLKQNSKDYLKGRECSVTNTLLKFMKKTCEVAFMVKAETRFYESVKVVGSETQLGGWTPDHGHLMSTSDLLYPYWYSVERVRLPLAKPVEFKLVMVMPDGAILWENLVNRQVQLTQDAVICFSWEHDAVKVDLNSLAVQLAEVPRKTSELVKEGSDSSLQGYFRMYNDHQRTDSILAILPQSTYFIDKSKISLIQPQQFENIVQSCINLQSFIFVTDPKTTIPANNLCLINHNTQPQAIKNIRSFKAIIFNQLTQLKMHLANLEKSGCRILSCFNNRVCVSQDSLHFVILSKFEPQYKENHKKLSNLLSRLTILIKQSQNTIRRTVCFNKLPDLENSFIILNNPKIEQLPAVNKLSHPQHLKVVVMKDPSAHLSDINQKINVIGECGRLTRINGIVQRKHNEAQKMLSSVRETIRKLGFGSLFNISEEKQAYLCLTCESTRLSSSVLTFISNEIRKNPMYKGIRIRKDRNKMYVFCHMEVVTMQEQLGIYQNDSVWIVGQPAYPEVFQQQSKVGYIADEKLILE